MGIPTIYPNILFQISHIHNSDTINNGLPLANLEIINAIVKF